MKIVLIGAGQRGRVYADYMMEKGCAQIVAIVEPNDVRRKEAAAQLGVAADWRREKSLTRRSLPRWIGIITRR